MAGAVMTYRTQDGDMLDEIAHTYLGSADGVHALLQANPGLAQFGPVLPAGVLVQIPDITATAPKATVRLWGSA